MYVSKGERMNKLVEQALLYDFYGELLTEHQRQVYEAVILNDFSESEIAKEAGISRQGVHDMIRRCMKILEGYESTLHLVSRFVGIKKKVEEIKNITKALACDPEPAQMQKPRMRQIEKIADDILDLM